MAGDRWSAMRVLCSDPFRWDVKHSLADIASTCQPSCVCFTPSALLHSLLPMVHSNLILTIKLVTDGEYIMVVRALARQKLLQWPAMSRQGVRLLSESNLGERF